MIKKKNVILFIIVCAMCAIVMSLISCGYKTEERIPIKPVIVDDITKIQLVRIRTDYFGDSVVHEIECGEHRYDLIVTGEDGEFTTSEHSKNCPCKIPKAKAHGSTGSY